MSSSAFKRLAKLAVRAFYSGKCPPPSYEDGEESGRSKLGKVDTTGLAVIVVDWMITREWEPETAIVDSIKVHHKLVRRALKYLEREHFLMSEHRRETRRSQKKDVVRALIGASAAAEKEAAAAAADEEEEDDGFDEEHAALMHRGHTISYYAMDYPRLFDALRLKLLNMRKVMKDELDAKEVLAKYVCCNNWCRKEYDSLEANYLIRPDGEMYCEQCENRVNQMLGGGLSGDDVARRERRKALQNRLTRINEQLGEMITLVEGPLSKIQPPFYGALNDWAMIQKQKLDAAACAQSGNGRDAGGGMGPGSSGGGGIHVLTAKGPLSYWQNTTVEVNLGEGSSSGAAGAGRNGASGSGQRPLLAGAAGSAAGSSKSGPAAGGAVAPGTKVLPPWMLRPGVSASLPSSSARAAGGASTDSKSAALKTAGFQGDDEDAAEDLRKAVHKRQVEQAYYQQYMAALAAQQKQVGTPSSGQADAGHLGGSSPASKRVKTEDVGHEGAGLVHMPAEVKIEIKQEDVKEEEEDGHGAGGGGASEDFEWEDT